jgi:hypothetical protein
MFTLLISVMFFTGCVTIEDSWNTAEIAQCNNNITITVGNKITRSENDWEVISQIFNDIAEISTITSFVFKNDGIYKEIIITIEKDIKISLCNGCINTYECNNYHNKKHIIIEDNKCNCYNNKEN